MTPARLSADEAVRQAAAVRDDPTGALRRWKALSGRKAIGCFPLYIPEEVLHAAGMLPVTLWGDEFPKAPPANLPPFLCGVVRGAFSSIRGGAWDAIDAWAIPSTCDTIQNAVEVLKAGGETRPLFPLVFPLSADLPGASEYLLDRIEAFVEWAGAVSGRLVTEGALEKAIAAFNLNRRLFARLEERMAESPGDVAAAEFLLLARAGSLLPRETHTELIGAVLARKAGRAGTPRARVFLTGMMATDDVASALDGTGAAVVGNDLGRGRRYYEGAADEHGDAALSLVRRHLSRGPCSTLHWAGRSRIDSLFARVSACGADRILMLRVRQCEPETGDEPDLAEEARRRGVPFLAVDVDPGSSGAAAALGVRIGAFVEMGE
jgi:benzoyl-CoA reductase/2-hydroxyglutaryl-CoA dehydratase subunit BcrC/BadD/HgdB